MHIKQKEERKIRIRDHPMGRSSSVSAIIHGDNLEQSNHYVDALERFKRDFATIEKNDQEKKKQIRKKEDERRRNMAILREMETKKHEEENIHKLLNRQTQSQALHQLGQKKTAHTHSIAVNPINLQYENNQRGKLQANLDEEQRINKLVRAHHLQTCGNSGYNIINGHSSSYLGSSIPEQSQASFQQKLSRYYDKFRIQPE